MRPLKRPMFRTGGPIKEGVMNGLRDGGVATTMADATMMAGYASSYARQSYRTRWLCW